ncbi:hypothetical protein NDU88_003827 [Pleurodeles waltl]|uniref:Uncharacterized protein n=1 Tax=Pleurodeles waltl TaxID=8319 RepID=A0AAV7KZK1_PLEWA|nr:hypothetical protein NDU88_003827 [Pleurodeles waltl]
MPNSFSPSLVQTDPLQKHKRTQRAENQSVKALTVVTYTRDAFLDASPWSLSRRLDPGAPESLKALQEPESAVQRKPSPQGREGEARRAPTTASGAVCPSGQSGGCRPRPGLSGHYHRRRDAQPGEEEQGPDGVRWGRGVHRAGGGLGSAHPLSSDMGEGGSQHGQQPGRLEPGTEGCKLGARHSRHAQ